jgi:leader peptidase (prepilin peptidase)/N-methyltransferase
VGGVTVAVNDLATLDLLARAVSAAFLFAFGACVGSFLNVVAYRLPASLSVIHPPSRCPTCGGLLAWRDNLPILGWLFLRGKCRHCREPISPQYPIVEAFTATLFTVLYLLFFALSPREPLAAWLGGATPWWHAQGFAYAWPAFIATLGLVSGLIAATLADLRTFLIPQPITRTVTVLSLVAWAVQPWVGVSWRATDVAPPIPLASWAVSGAALGGLAGTLVALGLKRLGVIPESFADWADHVKEGDAITAYPHARREMRKEAAFLVPVVAGLALGWFTVRVAAGGGHLDPLATPPPAVALPAASALGFLVAGGLVWFFRISGSLARGVEAMGMGDVHLLAAIGATLGWKAAVWTFALAPFPALAVELAKRIAARLRAGRVPGWMGESLPYGPYLALAALLVVLAGPAVARIERVLFFDPTAEIPARLERRERSLGGPPARPPAQPPAPPQAPPLGERRDR